MRWCPDIMRVSLFKLALVMSAIIHECRDAPKMAYLIPWLMCEQRNWWLFGVLACLTYWFLFVIRLTAG